MSAAMPERILIVEDSETQALRLQYLLAENGLAVSLARSAEAALDQLNGELPDLLITDMHLPGVSGIELCRRLRLGVNTRGIPILLLTSEEDSALEARALESGADDFVRKSGEPEILLLRIQALLRKSNVQQLLASAESHFASVRILIVEDSATYRALLINELESEGYRLETAATGEAALTLLAMQPFDAMILDLMLPDMSGHELCRRMAASRRTVDNAFMILALTGRPNRDDVAALLQAGADDVIGKSRDMGVIKARLRALVRRKLLFEENRRIALDIGTRERELLAERARREQAEARAALVERLERAMSELKETQSQLVQSAKMASLGQLVAGIAHEINNPTAFVTAHLQTVLRLCGELGSEVGPLLSTDSARKLAKIQQRLADTSAGVDRVRDLVQKLRTFSRLDEGEYKLASVSDNVAAVLAMLLHRTRGRIEVDCRLGEPDTIPCYPGLLNQALMNIIANAIDAIEASGAVGKRDGTGAIEISSGRVDGGYEIAVRDSGPGIALDIRDRVFEPFFTTKATGKGTGLGMSITYQIVRRHGGSIAIGGEPGCGTVISIRLPLSRSPPEATEEQPAHAGTAGARGSQGGYR